MSVIDDEALDSPSPRPPPSGRGSLHPLLRDAAAVIFDFDGVLVDSEPLHEEAIKRTGASRGWKMTREHFLSMVGKGDEHAMRLLARENGHELTDRAVVELCEEKHRHCLRLIQEKRFSVQPGVPELVGLVSAAMPAGVCSGSRRDVVTGMLAASGLAPFMRTVVTHEDVREPKPAPEGYLLAAARLGLGADAMGGCVVIEDSPTGIRAAKAAGMRVLAVCHSFGPERLGEADTVLRHISELVPLGRDGACQG